MKWIGGRFCFPFCFGLFWLSVDSWCVRHLPNACGCCVSWAMSAEVVRWWETPAFHMLWKVSLAWCLRLRCLSDRISRCVLGRGFMLVAETAQQTFCFQTFGIEPHWRRRLCCTKFLFVCVEVLRPCQQLKSCRTGCCTKCSIVTRIYT